MAPLARLRWRLAGATMWPAFAVATLAAAALLHWLPFAGDRGLGLVPAFLLAGFVNLAIVAAGAPAGGWLLRRRIAGLPKVVADDRAGTVLLGLLLAALVVGGLAHRGTIAEEEQDFEVQAIAAQRTIARQAPPEFRDGVLSTTKQGPDLFRTCAAGPEPSTAFCVLVTTDQHPPGVTVDPDRRPNEVVSGPENPGRRGS